MPIDLRYDAAKNILYATIQGQIQRNEFAEALRAITNSSEYPPDVAVLWDARFVEMSSVDSKYELELIGIRKSFPERGNSKIAIIVSSTMAFGMGRMYEQLSGSLPQNIMVFKEIEPGENWLQS
jgi:hypothetical protein